MRAAACRLSSRRADGQALRTGCACTASAIGSDSGSGIGFAVVASLCQCREGRRAERDSCSCRGSEWEDARCRREEDRELERRDCRTPVHRKCCKSAMPARCSPRCSLDTSCCRVIGRDVPPRTMLRAAPTIAQSTVARRVAGRWKASPSMMARCTPAAGASGQVRLGQEPSAT